MNWREILPKAKAERDKLQKQANEIEEKINRLDREIFDAEQGIKKMDEREASGEKPWAEVDCYGHPDNPPCCGEGE